MDYEVVALSEELLALGELADHLLWGCLRHLIYVVPSLPFMDIFRSLTRRRG